MEMFPTRTKKDDFSVTLPLGEYVRVFNFILFKKRIRNQNKYMQ